MTKEIFFSDATKLADLIRTKEVSPVEVVQAHLDRIAAVNPKINAIVTLADGALKAAILLGIFLISMVVHPFRYNASGLEHGLVKISRAEGPLR